MSFATVECAQRSRTDKPPTLPLSLTRIPRPHQLEAVDDSCAELSISDRTQCIMPCGTGKTLVGQLVAHRQGSRILLCEPSLNLVKQNLESWQQNYFDVPPKFLVVCSDQTVVSSNQDEIQISKNELVALSATVSSDPEYVRAFLLANPDVVVISTNHSLPIICEAMKDDNVRDFDCIVIDEADRTSVSADSAFGMIHDNTAIRASKRFYITATPKIFNEDESVVFSMDNEAVFGKVAHRLSFSDAVERGLLCDYQIVVAAISEKDHIVLDPGDTSLSSRYKLAELALKKACEKYDLRKILTFHARVDYAEKVAEHLPLVLGEDSWVHAIKGDTPMGQRANLLQKFGEQTRQTIAVLANCQCLKEGVDLPAIDAVAFFDERKSQIDLVQAIGRALRLSPGKTFGTIVIPVVVPEGVDAEQFLQSSRFKPVIQVLRALRSHDDRILGKFRAIAGQETGQKDEINPVGNEYLHLDLAGIDDKLSRSITAKVISVGLNIRGSLLTNRIIIEAARKYYDKYSELPVVRSDKEVPGMPEERWANIDTAAQVGGRGLEAGSSLYKILEPLRIELGLDKTLTEAAIINAAREFHKKYDYLPTSETTEEVPGMPGENWRRIAVALNKGLRGLDGSKTLTVLLEPLRKELGLEKTLSEAQIIAAARKFYELHKRLPTCETTEPVPGMERESWTKINSAGALGFRGLKKGRTLAVILAPLKSELGLDKTLSEPEIVNAARAFYAKYSRLPTRNSTEEVPGMPGEKWANIDSAGKAGLRGLQTGRSLSVILSDLRKELEILLTEDGIRAAAREFHRLHKILPDSRTQLAVPGMPHESWRKIDVAGTSGERGLTKGRSLVKILEPLRVELGLSKNLSEDAILTSARTFFHVHKKLPTAHSPEEVPGMPGEKWRNINQAGVAGTRGLTVGRTLALILKPLREELIEKKRGT